MKEHRSLAGIGGIAFGVLTFVAFLVGGPPGGDYDTGNIADFVDKGHRPALWISLYLMLIASLGLIVVMAYLREAVVASPRIARVLWATAVAGAGAFAIGWALALTVPVSLAIGGGPQVAPELVYTFSQGGLGVIFLVGGLMLGFALIALFLGAAAVPGWFRWATGVAGVLGLASPAFFPFFALLLWGLVVGVWLVLSARPAEIGSPQAT